MKKRGLLGLLLILVVLVAEQYNPTLLSLFSNDTAATAPSTGLTAKPATKHAATGTQAVYQKQHNKQQIADRGQVVKLLADDNKGSRHQRFILRLASGQTLLVAHNIDLAPYLQDLKVGDSVEFVGEYVWNDKGGILHWTHHDPKGRHPGGWLKHNGRLYQ